MILQLGYAQQEQRQRRGWAHLSLRLATYRVLFCSCACACSRALTPTVGSLNLNPWMSPALTDAMPWVHRGLSSGPCKPRRPLSTLQPNGYAKLPFVCHRHDRHQRARLLWRAGAERKHARALGSWHGCGRCALVEGHAHCHCYRHGEK